MRYSIIACLLTLPFLIIAQQKWDYIWVMGYDGNYTGIPEIGEGFIMDFNGSIVEPVFFEKTMNARTDNLSMSDAEGGLIFYSNGCTIFNKEHVQLKNGGNINPGTWHENFCAYGYPMNQGMLCLPKPDQDNIYSVLHIAYADNPLYSDRLYYSEIDISGDNGLGEVILKNNPSIADSLWAGYLTGVKSADNNSWWIIVQRAYSNKFIKLLLDSNGLEIVDEQEIGLPSEIAGAAGQALFSPEGTKYVRYDPLRNVQLFDFDRETGMLSNFQQLIVSDTVYWGGAAISSNSRFLYVSNAIQLYQFDLQSQDIQSSKVLIDVFDGTISPAPANFNLMQLAPDCRIYMSTGNGTDKMHVIDHPNRIGVECGFRQSAIQLPSYNAGTIPNNPNYRLGTPYPVCDSTIQLVTSTVRVRPPVQEVRVWPNPATISLTLELPAPLPAGAVWSLHAATGQPVRQEELATGQTQHTIPLAGLPPGLYFWEVRSQGRRVGSGKLVVMLR